MSVLSRELTPAGAAGHARHTCILPFLAGLDLKGQLDNILPADPVKSSFKSVDSNHLDDPGAAPQAHQHISATVLCHKLPTARCFWLLPA